MGKWIEELGNALYSEWQRSNITFGFSGFNGDIYFQLDPGLGKCIDNDLSNTLFLRPINIPSQGCLMAIYLLQNHSDGFVVSTKLPVLFWKG